MSGFAKETGTGAEGEVIQVRKGYWTVDGTIVDRIRQLHRRGKKKKYSWVAAGICLVAACLICLPLLMIPG